MYEPKVTKFRIEVENRQRVPQRTWLPEPAALRLWALAKSRREHPSETASALLLQALFPKAGVRKRLLRKWRREIWNQRGQIRREMAA